MKSFLLWLLIGVVIILVLGWVKGQSGLILKIQKRMSSEEGFEAFIDYMREHEKIIQMSPAPIPDSIKLVFNTGEKYASLWIRVLNGNEKQELKKLYEAIKEH